MSELALQHETVRQRLGMPSVQLGRVRLELIGRRVRLEAPPEPAPAFLAYTPFNFLKAPGWRAIVKLVSLKHRVGPAEILSPDRNYAVTAARQEAVWLVWKHCNKSLPEIGELFDRDHSTIHHSIRKIERLRKERGHG